MIAVTGILKAQPEWKSFTNGVALAEVGWLVSFQVPRASLH